MCFLSLGEFVLGLEVDEVAQGNPTWEYLRQGNLAMLTGNQLNSECRVMDRGNSKIKYNLSIWAMGKTPNVKQSDQLYTQLFHNAIWTVKYYFSRHDSVA